MASAKKMGSYTTFEVFENPDEILRCFFGQIEKKFILLDSILVAPSI